MKLSPQARQIAINALLGALDAQPIPCDSPQAILHNLRRAGIQPDRLLLSLHRAIQAHRNASRKLRPRQLKVSKYHFSMLLWQKATA